MCPLRYSAFGPGTCCVSGSVIVRLTLWAHAAAAIAAVAARRSRVLIAGFPCSGFRINYAGHESRGNQAGWRADRRLDIVDWLGLCLNGSRADD